MRFKRIVLTPSLLERFNARVEPQPDGCWLWTGALGHGSYGYLYSAEAKGMVIASRVALTIAQGPIPDGMDACHTCDNPPCVNPDHLFAGTRLTNVRDMFAKGRQRRHVHPSHCPSGHAYTPMNTRVYRLKDGTETRRCRQCAEIAWRAYEAKRSAVGRVRRRVA